MLAYNILNRDTASIFINGNMFTISRTGHTAFDKLLTALEANDEKLVISLITTKDYFLKYLKSVKVELSFEGDSIYYGDEKLFGPLVDKILRFQKEGLPVASLTKFLDNLMQNPSRKSREQFYTFLDKYHFAVTPDGHFLGYKAVREDYSSLNSGPGIVNGAVTSGHLDNSIGNIVEMDRETVDPDSHKHCSTGLHVANLRYAQNFGGQKVVVLKVNPRDVVSVPTDSNAEKIRVCRYEVVSDFAKEYTDDYTPLFDAPKVPELVKEKLVLDSGNTKNSSFKSRLQNLSNKYSCKGKVASNIFTLTSKLEEANGSSNMVKFVSKLNDLYPDRYSRQPIYNYHLKAVLGSM